MNGSQLDDEAIFNVARTIESPASREAYLRQSCLGIDYGMNHGVRGA